MKDTFKLFRAEDLAGNPRWFANIQGEITTFVPKTKLTEAAPDLLDACENLLAVAEDKEGVYGIYQIYVDQARAAIAKAKEA